MTRIDKVEELTKILIETLLNSSSDTSANEMLSAVLTLTNHLIEVLLRMGADPEALRAALNQIAAQIPNDSRTIH